MRRGIFVLVALVAASTPGATLAGSYVPPPGDARPAWSPDGSRVAFLTTRGGLGLAVVSADGSGETRLLDGYGGPSTYPDPTDIEVSPDWQWVAVTRFVNGGGLRLKVLHLDGSGERELAATAYGTPPAWSPDSTRIAFRQSDQTLAVVGLDGSGPV